MAEKELPAFQTFYFHPLLIDKSHRDSCVSCQFALAGMTLFVELIKDQEKPKIDEY